MCNSVAFDSKDLPIFTWDKVFIQNLIQAQGQSTAHVNVAQPTFIETCVFPVYWLQVLFRLL